MIKTFLLTALAIVTLGTVVPADAQQGERRGRGDYGEQRDDRGGRYGRPPHGQFGHHPGYNNNGGRYPDRRYRGRYYNHGRYYQNRYRHHGGWRYR